MTDTPPKSNGTLNQTRSTFFRVGFVLGLAAVISATAFSIHLRDNWGAVAVGKVYRSAQPTAERIREYARNPGIRTVVNLRGEWENADWYRNERAAAAELGMEMYDVPLFTHRLAPMAELRKLVDVFDNAPKPILLHCRRGADRTSLATAVYLALFENASLDQAMKAYQFWHGHVGFARGAGQPHLFDFYSEWLTAHGYSHSSTRFREWIATTKNVAHFAAYIESPDVPKQLTVGQACKLRFHIANMSEYPWKSAKPIENGVHFWLWTYCRANGAERTQRLALPVDRVEAGTTITLEATLPGFNQPGTVQVAADLHDADQLKFREMGQGGWNRSIEIVAK